MLLIFAKTAGKHDRLEIVHDDGRAERLDCPKQGIAPHEMAHFAVEDTLRARGFLGRVRDGEAASMRMEGKGESDGVERLVEVLQADGWSGWTGAAADLLDLYRTTCAARGCPMLDVDAADLDAARARLRDLDARWRALPVGGTMALAFT